MELVPALIPVRNNSYETHLRTFGSRRVAAGLVQGDTCWCFVTQQHQERPLCWSKSLPVVNFVFFASHSVCNVLCSVVASRFLIDSNVLLSQLYLTLNFIVCTINNKKKVICISSLLALSYEVLSTDGLHQELDAVHVLDLTPRSKRFTRSTNRNIDVTSHRSLLKRRVRLEHTVPFISSALLRPYWLHTFQSNAKDAVASRYTLPLQHSI